jgi:eukaryotic-like serine/threonine-protein kinase
MSPANSPPPDDGRPAGSEHPDAATVKAADSDQSPQQQVEPPSPLISPALRATPVEPATLPEAPRDEQPVEPYVLAGYEILGEIARGGMGVVYKARQLSLDRMVALKCLPQSFRDDPDRLERFQIEIRAAAKLTKHGIVPVYDVLKTGGTPVLVMPYIPGSDLAHIIADRIAVRQKHEPPDNRHSWAALADVEYVERILGLLDRVIDALVLLHESDVLHRDIKPSNVLVDKSGNGWLADFGLARFGKHPGADWRVQTVGTPGFMSPEQWDGADDTDGRADVFSLGVAAYQALTLGLPYAKKRVTLATPLPPPVSSRNPLVPERVEAVIAKALQPDRSQRYQSAAELKQDWDRARHGPSEEAGSWWSRATRWRRAAVIAAAAALPLLGVAGAWALSLFGPPPPEPPEPPTVTVLVTTEPVGATVVFVPLHPDTGEPEKERAVRPPPGKTTPLEIELAPGPYFIEAEIEAGTVKHRFHQVYRQVPQPGQTHASFPHRGWAMMPDGKVEIPEIKIPEADVTAKMTRFNGSRDFLMGSAHLTGAQPPHVHPVAAFFLDAHEVTEGEYREARKRLPAALTENRGDNFAVTMVSYEEAESCAEIMGKRLPTEAEYEWAATMGGAQDFPWGNDKEHIQNWLLLPVGQPDFDRTRTDPPVFGLYSNVAEWTTTWHMPYPTPLTVSFPDFYRSTRTVRGAPYWVVIGGKPNKEESLWGPRYRYGVSIDRALPGLGFRCARSVQPLFLPH